MDNKKLIIINILTIVAFIIIVSIGLSKTNSTKESFKKVNPSEGGNIYSENLMKKTGITFKLHFNDVKGDLLNETDELIINEITDFEDEKNDDQQKQTPINKERETMKIIESKNSDEKGLTETISTDQTKDRRDQENGSDKDDPKEKGDLDKGDSIDKNGKDNPKDDKNGHEKSQNPGESKDKEREDGSKGQEGSEEEDENDESNDDNGRGENDDHDGDQNNEDSKIDEEDFKNNT